MISPNPTSQSKENNDIDRHQELNLMTNSTISSSDDYLSGYLKLSSQLNHPPLHTILSTVKSRSSLSSSASFSLAQSSLNITPTPPIFHNPDPGGNDPVLVSRLSQPSTQIRRHSVSIETRRSRSQTDSFPSNPFFESSPLPVLQSLKVITNKSCSFDCNSKKISEFYPQLPPSKTRTKFTSESLEDLLQHIFETDTSSYKTTPASKSIQTKTHSLQVEAHIPALLDIEFNRNPHTHFLLFNLLPLLVSMLKFHKNPHDYITKSV